MEREIIVFDFDKTLTYKDTLLAFYVHVSPKSYRFPCKLLFYFFCMFLFKMKVISNNGLKIVGFNLFLKGLKNEYIEARSKAFSSRIKYNNLFKDFDFENKERRIFIISASFEVYLKYCFPGNVNVIGSKYCLSKKRAEKFTFNCYSSTKKKVLCKKGIDKIDVFFTDSFSDFSLAEVSKEINVVAGDKIVKMKSVASFKSYFKK